MAATVAAALIAKAILNTPTLLFVARSAGKPYQLRAVTPVSI
jgi:hypothetical protein